MKKLIFISLIFILGSTFIRAQELLGGELIFDFIDRPSEWDLDIYIEAIGPVWDKDHYITNQYPGGTKYYNENSQFPNTYPGHASDACWDYQGYDPPLALGLYKITVSQYVQDSEYWVSFYFDWRTSDLPSSDWDDQRFMYSINDNKIYRYLDPYEVSINGQRLTIWDENDEIDHITSGLELYLTVSSQNNNPYLEWNEYNDPNILGYNIYRKITMNGGNYTNVIFTTSTSYLDINFYIPPPKEPGNDLAEYWIKAKISPTEESLEGNHVQVGGTSIIQWKISDKERTDNLTYSLNQNYPNPFNPVTTIEFTLKESSIVSLRVFDILGREVKLILNEMLEAGIHQLEFNGSDLESGIYFYEMQAGNFRDVKKFVLLK